MGVELYNKKGERKKRAKIQCHFCNWWTYGWVGEGNRPSALMMRGSDSHHTWMMSIRGSLKRLKGDVEKLKRILSAM